MFTPGCRCSKDEELKIAMACSGGHEIVVAAFHFKNRVGLRLRSYTVNSLSTMLKE